MTDEQMDARLRSAGAAWRSGLDDAATGADAVTDDTASGGASSPPEAVAPAAPTRVHRHRRIALLASAAVVAAALVLLGSLVFRDLGGDTTGGTAGAQTSFAGTVWRLVGYGDQQRLPNSSSTLYLGRDGHLVADDGCTLLTARVDVRGGRLHPAQLSVRYKPCTDSVGEVTFTRAVGILKGQPEYSRDGDALTIGSMHLVAAPNLPVPSPDIPTLVGARWQLVRVTDADGHAHPVSGAPSLRVSGGELRASDGCGAAMRAQVDVSGSRIVVTDSQISSRPPCPGAPHVTADVVDAVLAGPTLQAHLRATTLTISRSAAGTLRYTWVPEDPRTVAPNSLTGTTWRLDSIAGRPAPARATLLVDADGTFTGNDGCRNLAGRARLGTGVMTLTGVPSRPPSGCAGADQASTIDSFLASPPVRWAVRDGRLLIFGGGAQAFSLVYEAQSD